MGKAICLLLGITLAAPFGPVCQADESLESARARTTLHAVTPGSNLVVVLRDGARLKGKLVDVSQDGFSLYLPVSKKEEGKSATRAGAIKSSLSFEQVLWVEPSKPKWIHPGRIGSIEKGQKIELLLLSGKRVSGWLDSLTQDELVLTRGGEVTAHPLDEIAAVREKRLPRFAKIALGIGIGYAVLGLVTYAMVGGQAQ